MKQIFSLSPVRYIIAGVSAYAFELSCIFFLHSVLHLSASVSTAIAFWISLPVAFLLQKIFAFKDFQKTLRAISSQMAMYSALIVLNWFFVVGVVSIFPDSWLVFSRTLGLIVTTGWNFFAYQYMFKHRTPPTKQEAKQFFVNAFHLKNKVVNGILLALPVIAFTVPLLLTGDKVSPGDPDYYFQIYEAFRRSVLDFGQFPSWNPWVAGGIPLFANIQFGLISIQAPLVLIFGSVMGIKLAITAYLLIGFFGFKKLFQGALKTPAFTAICLAYIGVFCSFFTYRIMAGHFTFLLFAFVPWLLYFYLQRKQHSKNWLWFALIFSLMVWSAPHYTTIMSVVAIGLWAVYYLVSQLFVAIRAKKYQPFLQALRRDALFFAKAGAVIVALCAYRIYFVLSFLKDFPRLEDASAEPFTGVLRGLYTMWGPDQYGAPPQLPAWGWAEMSTYIGIGTAICTVLILGICAWRAHKKMPQPLTYSVWLLVALFATFFILGMGDFGPYSPYRLLNHLPIFDSMRVAPRWLLWSALCILIGIAAHSGKTLRKTINAILLLTACELFITGALAIATPYQASMVQYRSPQDAFNQQYFYRLPRPNYAADAKFLAVYPYDENLTETTKNNYGQVIAGDSLVDTRKPGSTARCGANLGICPLISSNARISYWSPNKIVVQRTGDGTIYLNMNPGRDWKINGAYAFEGYKITDPLRAFAINNTAQTIVIEYAPALLPAP